MPKSISDGTTSTSLVPQNKFEEILVIVKLRTPIVGTCLAAALGVLSATSPMHAELPKDLAKKTVAADIAVLQKKLVDIAADPAKNKGSIRTVKALTLIISAHGDDAAKGQAAKVLLAIVGKDYKKASEIANGFSSAAADAAAVKSAAGKYDLDDIMSPFRVAKSGGLNIEKDIRDAMKSGKIEPKDAELIGSRSAALAEYTLKMPNDKAKTAPAMTAKWERWSKEMAANGKELAESAAGGDQKKLVTTLKKLDASCSNCHNDFRE